jgi:hypothetical protein
MKVTGLETILIDNVPPYRGGIKWLFIKLTTDEGIVGLGERVTGGVTNLAPQIAMLENLFDPEAVIIGGALPPGLLEDLTQAMQPLPLSVARRRNRSEARLIQGRTGRLTAALGAAALPLLETMTPRLDTAQAAKREQPNEEMSLAG